MMLTAWSPLQQRHIDNAHHRIRQVAGWEDQSAAMDHLAHLARDYVAKSHGETGQWAACYRHVATILQSTVRLTGRRLP